MAKKSDRPDLKIEKNAAIPDEYRAEYGRDSVSPGPQRKHDTPAYHDTAVRGLHLLNAEPVDPVADKDLGEVVRTPGDEPSKASK